MPLGYVIPQSDITIHDSKGRVIEHMSASARKKQRAQVVKRVKRELAKQKRK